MEFPRSATSEDSSEQNDFDPFQVSIASKLLPWGGRTSPGQRTRDFGWKDGKAHAEAGVRKVRKNIRLFAVSRDFDGLGEYVGTQEADYSRP